MTPAAAAATRMATFHDPDLEAELDEVGFVVVDLLSSAQVALLAEIAERVYVDDRTGFHASNLSGQHEYRHAVAREVQPVLEPIVSPLLVDHESYTASLLMKWPDEDSAFHTHQDWTMVDEQRYRTVNAWCPLVDTDESNGALRVLPGSHRVLRAIRCSPMPPQGSESPGWQVGWEEMVAVPVAAGQALIFDHAVLHSSGPNRSPRPRPAVAAAFKPREAELRHWYLPDPTSDRLEVFSIDAAFFADIDIGSRPEGEPTSEATFEPDDFDKATLLERCGVTSHQPSHERPLLRDPHAWEQLDRDGWVVVDLFDDEQVDQLNRRHAELDHEVTLDRSFAAGFHATIMDGREAYRRCAHDAIAEVVEEPFARTFDGLTLTLTNWLHKSPGGAAVPYHVDWSFVDEDRHRSLSVWAPLVDTDETTGCIGVITGSHREVRFIRAAAHPSYTETDRYGSTLPGSELVPLRAGQAVVFDHRLVHFSAPHTGSAARIAITCELVPTGAEVLHFEQLGPGRFRRHVVTPEFFVTYASGDDPRERPGHLGWSDVDGASFDQLHPVATSVEPSTPPPFIEDRPDVRPTAELAAEAVAATPARRDPDPLEAPDAPPNRRFNGLGNQLRRVAHRLRRRSS